MRAETIPVSHAGENINTLLLTSSLSDEASANRVMCALWIYTQKHMILSPKEKSLLTCVNIDHMLEKEP
jgi:hypothetical protein